MPLLDRIDSVLGGHNASTFDSYANAAMNAAARDRIAQNGHGGDSTANDRARQGVEAGRRVQAMFS